MATRVPEMTFGTELNQKHTLRVPNVKNPYTGVEAVALMDKIIARNIINTDNGALTTKISARIVTFDSADLSLVKSSPVDKSEVMTDRNYDYENSPGGQLLGGLPLLSLMAVRSVQQPHYDRKPEA